MRIHLVDQRKGILRQCCTIWLQSWHFFARETTLVDRYNQTLIISRFVSLFPFATSFSFFSDRSSPLSHDTAFPSPSGCQRSPVIPFIFRCSLLTREFPWLRYPPGGWNQSYFCSLHLSFASFLSLCPSFPLLFSPSTALQFSAVPACDHLRSSDVAPSIGPAVGCNYDVVWRRVRAASRPVAFTIARCTHRPTLGTTGHLRFTFRQGDESFEMCGSRRLSTLLHTCEFRKCIASYIHFRIRFFSADSTKKKL